MRRGGREELARTPGQPSRPAAHREFLAELARRAWKPIRYLCALPDDRLSCWISGTQVAEARCVAFTSRKGEAITAQLIVPDVLVKLTATTATLRKLPCQCADPLRQYIQAHHALEQSGCLTDVGCC